VRRLSTLTPGLLYPQRRSLALISVRDWVDPSAIVRQEGSIQWKISNIPPRIEPTVFRLVTQCPHQLRSRVPLTHSTANHGRTLLNCRKPVFSKWYCHWRFIQFGRESVLLLPRIELQLLGSTARILALWHLTLSHTCVCFLTTGLCVLIWSHHT
jgi:hypothetical protein